MEILEFTDIIVDSSHLILHLTLKMVMTLLQIIEAVTALLE